MEKITNMEKQILRDSVQDIRYFEERSTDPYYATRVEILKEGLRIYKEIRRKSKKQKT